MKIFLETILNEDHERIDSLFEQYLKNRKDNRQTAPKLFDLYRESLLKHMKCEEELIFPVLEQNPKERGAREVPDLLQEHELIRECLARVLHLCQTGSDELGAAERHLFEELHEHNAREEMHVYPVLDKLFNRGEAASVTKRIGV